MKKTSLKVSEETRTNLEKLKQKFSYFTYDDCIRGLCSFVEENGINPKKSYVDDVNTLLLSRMDTHYLEYQKLLKEQVQSLRKFQGAMEKQYFKPMAKRLAISEIAQEENTEQGRVSEVASLKQGDCELKYKEMLKYLISKIEKRDYGLFGEHRFFLEMEEKDFEKFKNEIV